MIIICITQQWRSYATSVVAICHNIIIALDRHNHAPLCVYEYRTGILGHAIEVARWGRGHVTKLRSLSLRDRLTEQIIVHCTLNIENSFRIHHQRKVMPCTNGVLLLS